MSNDGKSDPQVVKFVSNIFEVLEEKLTIIDTTLYQRSIEEINLNRQ